MSAKPVLLKDLLRLSFSEPVHWLHGKDCENCQVLWISTAVEEAQPGELLLAPAALFDAGLIVEAQKRQVAGIAVLGAASLPEGLTPGPLAILALPGYARGLREAQRILLTNLINHRAAVLERGARILSQLAQLQAEGKGLEGLAKAMGEISGRGVLIQDKRGFVRAEYCNSALVTIWKDVLQQLGSLEGLPDSLVDRKRAGSQRAVSSQSIPGGLERLIVPITVGEIARGYLSLVGISGELDELDHLVVDQGERVCAMEMARTKAVREAEKRLKGDLLTALLQNTLSPREARLWVQTMGIDPDQGYVAMRFSWAGPALPSRRRLETLVNGEVLRLGLQVVVSPMGSEVVCFCQETPGATRPVQALALGEAVLRQGAQEYAEAPGRCGVGTIALALEDWRTSLQHSGQALEMARRLGERKPLYYADLSVYRLLLQMEHSPELIAFQEETLGPLLAYEGGSELLQTLEVFFEYNGNLSQAAEALFVHRNTLIYRLERIARITDLDLSKQENRLAIQLALRIHRMTKHNAGEH
jgi:purine catabolism regulator